MTASTYPFDEPSGPTIARVAVDIDDLNRYVVAVHNERAQLLRENAGLKAELERALVERDTARALLAGVRGSVR